MHLSEPPVLTWECNGWVSTLCYHAVGAAVAFHSATLKLTGVYSEISFSLSQAYFWPRDDIYFPKTFEKKKKWVQRLDPTTYWSQGLRQTILLTTDALLVGTSHLWPRVWAIGLKCSKIYGKWRESSPRLPTSSRSSDGLPRTETPLARACPAITKQSAAGDGGGEEPVVSMLVIFMFMSVLEIVVLAFRARCDRGVSVMIVLMLRSWRFQCGWRAGDNHDRVRVC